MLKHLLFFTLLISLQACGNKGENQNDSAHKETLDSVPPEHIRSTGDERSVPLENDSIETDSVH
jgi:hypothetical protein